MPTGVKYATTRQRSILLDWARRISPIASTLRLGMKDGYGRDARGGASASPQAGCELKAHVGGVCAHEISRGRSWAAAPRPHGPACANSPRPLAVPCHRHRSVGPHWTTGSSTLSAGVSASLSAGTLTTAATILPGRPCNRMRWGPGRRNSSSTHRRPWPRRSCSNWPSRRKHPKIYG